MAAGDGEQQLFAALEVLADGSNRDLCAAGDLGGGRLGVAFVEQLEQRVDDRLARACFARVTAVDFDYGGQGASWVAAHVGA